MNIALQVKLSIIQTEINQAINSLTEVSEDLREIEDIYEILDPDDIEDLRETLGDAENAMERLDNRFRAFYKQLSSE